MDMYWSILTNQVYEIRVNAQKRRNFWPKAVLKKNSIAVANEWVAAEPC